MNDFEDCNQAILAKRIDAVSTCAIDGMYYLGPHGPNAGLTCPMYYFYGHGAVKRGPIICVKFASRNHAIKFKAANYVELMEQLLMLCTTCHFPCGNCSCVPRWAQTPGDWVLMPDQGKRLPRSIGKLCLPNRYIMVNYVSKNITTQGLVKLQLDCSPKNISENYVIVPENCKTQILMGTVISEESNVYCKLSEDVLTLVHQWYRSRTVEDSTLAVGAFIRSVTGVSVLAIGQSAVLKLVTGLYSDIRTQGPGLSSTIEDMWNNYSSVKNSILAKKVMRVLNHIIAVSIFYKLNIPWDAEKFEKLEKEQTKYSVKDYVTMADALADLITFLLKTGRQFMLTGKTSSFFIDGDSVGDWYTRANILKKNFDFLSNPKAAGIELHSYLKDLRFCIDEGNCLARSLRKDSPEWRLAFNLATDLQVCENKYMSIANALSMRAAPLGVVLYGSPGVGKSHITNSIANFYALRYGLDPSSEFRFQHSSEEEYFTNFKTYMHTIILDDVAQHRPDRVQGVDPSISALIKIFNNMPFSPPQAALDDKGKTPLICELGIVTTNVLHMNIPYYFSKSYAAMRRLSVHIEPIVKAEFKKSGSDALDPNKTGDNLYGEYWDYIIREPQEKQSMIGEYVIVKKFSTMAELFNWLGPVMDRHRRNQQNMVAKGDCFKNVSLCDSCKIPKELCNCELRLQSSITRLHQYDEEISTAEFQNDESEFLFVTDPTDETPWRRPTSKCRAPRFFSMLEAKRFLEYCSNRYPGDDFEFELNCCKIYAYNSLGFLMSKGWTDSEIWRDVEAYIVYYRDIVDHNFERDSHLKTEEDASIFKCYYFKIMLFFIFECSFTRYILNKLAYFKFMDRITTSLFYFVMDSHAKRKQVLVHAGRWYDKKLCGMNPIVAGLLLSATLLTTIALGYKMVVQCTNTYYTKQVREDDEEDDKKRWREKCVASLTELENQATAIEYNHTVLNKNVGDHRLYHQELSKNIDFQTWREKYFAKLNEIKEMVENRVFETIPIKYENADMSKIGPSKKANCSPESVCEPQTQGILHEFGRFPESAAGDDKKNIWVAKERVLTSFDFMPNRATNLEALTKALKRCVVNIEICGTVNGNMKMYFGRGIILDRNTILINAHALFPGENSLNVYCNNTRGTSVAKVTLHPRREQMVILLERDLCFIKTLGLPPLYSSIQNNLVRSSFDTKCDGYYIIKQIDGSLLKKIVRKIEKVNISLRVGDNYFRTSAYIGTPDSPTEDGECGAPLIMETGYGPVVVGIHFLYDSKQNIIYATKLCYEDVDGYLNDINIEVGSIDTQGLMTHVPDKSFIDFHDNAKVIYHGELMVHKVRPKTRTMKTEIADQLFNMPCFADFKFEDKYTAPLMHTWIPQQVSLREYVEPAVGIDEIVVMRCASIFAQHILDNLPKSELDLIHPYPIDVAVNGFPGMAYVDAIKKSTSMGYPFHRSKRGYLQPLEDQRWPDGVKFSPEIEKKIEELMKKYLRGERAHPIFSSNLKDEAVSQAKYDSGKTRVFFSCPYDFLVVVRMMFLGYSRVVQRNWKTFHCVIGVNCHSTQWEEIYQLMIYHGLDRFIAGDFQFFDKKFPLTLMRWAFWIVKTICIASGNYNHEMRVVMECIELDLVNPTINWFGMLITLIGGEVSGHQLTTILNNKMGMLYIMYAYSTVYDPSTFFDNVQTLFLGDDHFCGVSETKPLFNHTMIKDVLKNIGVGYTMAVKTQESVPYIHISEVTFLKRTFRFHKGLGAMCAPLDKTSIMKMLTYHTKSKSVCASESLAQAFTAASMEAFYHGRDFFDYINRCIDMCDKSKTLLLYMDDYPRISWNENITRFWLASGRGGAAMVLCRNQIDPEEDSDCMDTSPPLDVEMRMDPFSNDARAFPEDGIYREVRHHLEQMDISEVNGLKLQTKIILPSKSNLELNNNETPQEEEASIIVQETTSFAHERNESPTDMTTPHDSVADMLILTSDLKTYLSRPAKIQQFTWNVGGAPGIVSTFSPWADFFNVVSIRKKIENFKYMRCNLHLKFVINASPFYYGAIGAFYQPLHIDSGDRLSTWNASAPGQQILLSQRQKVWLNPQNTSTQELILPFLHYNYFVDMALNANLDNLGKIDFVQYTELRSANGVTTGGVTINVYAWASEVELSGATSRPTLQGKTEYVKNGQISGPASTISKVAGKLSNIPGIGPFARATEVVSGAIGDVASFFGYTNVPVVEDVMPFKPTSFHTLASSTISEPINKLSLQPKQETCVGMYHGDNSSDPLVISNFIARESFLCGTLWTTVQGENTILFTGAITPALHLIGGVDPTKYTDRYYTPLSFMSSMFQYWSGDIIFRFKVIKSKYHKGRLNICWDVGCNRLQDMPTVGDPSVFNIIMDLEEDDEIEVRVPWTQAYPVLACNTSLGGGLWSNGTGAASAPFVGNGTIQVRVLNTLSAPIATSDVDVLVFVRGAENLKFSAPVDLNSLDTLLRVQGKVIDFGRTSEQPPNKFTEVFGEEIVSLRELLHRSSKAWTQVQKKSGTGADWTGFYQYQSWPLARLPKPVGFSASGWEAALGPVSSTYKPYNFVRNHPLTYTTACFIGMKGSVNITVNGTYSSNGNSSPLPSVSLARRTTVAPIGVYPYSLTDASTLGTSQMMSSINYATVEPNGSAGMALTNQHTQAGLAVNLPYYVYQKFQVVNLPLLYSYGAGTENLGTNQDIWDLYIRRFIADATPDYKVQMEVFYGTGPDFDMIYFLNVPLVCTLLSQPTAQTGD